MNFYFILDENKRVQPAADVFAWAKFMESDVRFLAAEEAGVGVNVSTVFIGLLPHLFETMIFGGPLDERAWRAQTYAEAMVNHKNAVEAAMASMQ